MNILFLQESPCIRNWKMATALRSRGHRVSLGYTRARISQMYLGLADDAYDANVRVGGFEHLQRLVRQYDLVHCHNEPDVLTVRALQAMGPPVIHDCHDVMSLRGPADLQMEAAAQVGSAGRIYVSEAQMEICQARYAIDAEYSMVFHNTSSRAMLPKLFLPKLSLIDGKTRVVYQGSVSAGDPPHRDYRRLLGAVAEAGICVHIHPNMPHPAYASLSQRVSRIHLHAPTSPLDLLTTMTQYDWGIAPLVATPANQQHLDTALPNKPFEYVSAGLPVIFQDLPMMRRYWQGREAGFFFGTAEDVIRGISRGRDQYRPQAPQRVYEDEIGRIEAFYAKVLEAPHAEGRSRSRTAVL